jgi:alpha-L-arabinofuranosidase
VEETHITLHTAFGIGEVDPRIFGGFLEHMGRCVYEGVFEPSSVHTVDSSAILDGDRLHVFATNRSLEADAPLRITLADRAIAKLEECEVVTGDDPKAENSFEDPNRICAAKFQEVKVCSGGAVASLPCMSVAAMSFALD